jgi:uncharacterized membrane protein YeaQ/YmgE (transglycosylase-associated protein family)
MHSAEIIGGSIVIGLLAGWIADMATGRRLGLLTTLVIGLVGSSLGAFIANVLNVTYAGSLGQLAVSTTGAIALLLLLALVRRRA